MIDIEFAKSVLKKNNANLVIVKDGKLLFETHTTGIRGLLNAVDEIGEKLKGSAVADKIVGEAAAQLLAYSRVNRVFAITLSECGRDILTRNDIECTYESLVPHILNLSKTDLCPFEKTVAGANSPTEAYQRLRKSVLAMRPKP